MPYLNARLTSLGQAVIIGLALLTSSSTFSATNNDEIKQTTLQEFFYQERKNAGLQTKSIQVGEIQWVYNEGGESNRPAVLLLHGLTGNKDNWNRVARYLTPYYHVIVPDLPTNGETQVPENFDISVPNITSELHQFAQSINISKNLNIAGHSVGGSIATVYASQYPFDTQSLFLLSSAGIYKQAKTEYAKNPKFLKNLLVSKPGDFESVLNKLMISPPILPSNLKLEQEQLLISQNTKNNQAIDQIIKLNRIYTPDSFARLTRTIEAPTLIMWGKQDQIINYEVANELESLLKRADPPVILENVGHLPIIEAEQQVAQYYLPFLSKTQNLKNPLADKLIPLN